MVEIWYVGLCDVGDVGCLEFGMLRMWNVWDVGGMLGMQDVCDVGYWGCGMLGYGMFGMWNVGCWLFARMWDADLQNVSPKG